MKIINGRAFDEERALYGAKDIKVTNCVFEGPADGESAFKESRNIEVNDCAFRLRYPFWNTENAQLNRIQMSDTCRAPIWYSNGTVIADSEIFGVKALRESKNTVIKNTKIDSPEFGWFCDGLEIENCEISGTYFLFHSNNIVLRNVHLTGKYSFQYCKNIEIYDSVLDTKDAFWQSENVRVENSTVNGEYLAWHAKDVYIKDSKMSGTQPFCYSENINIERSTAANFDLAFEYSTVNADIIGDLISIKNPIKGKITADSIGEIIFDENRRDSNSVEIEIRK